MHTVRVWDLPTRIFHWGLACCFAILVTTAEVGGDAMRWHFWTGYCVISLLLFRLVWGFVGGRWSRFSNFVTTPSGVIRYLTDSAKAKLSVGHNPLGAMSVICMLLFAAMQVGTGLLSDDEIAAAGPLAKMVSSEVVGWSTFYHADVGKWILISLVALHVAAILFYYVRKGENLVSPMVLGDKLVTDTVESSKDDRRSRFLALVVFILCSGSVALLVNWAG